MMRSNLRIGWRRVSGVLGVAGAAAARPGRARRRAWRRGVASVLAMMFVVLFGSLAVAMAIVSKGNLRTAQTNLHVIRAMGAADTGLAVARARLAEAASRFVVERGTVDADFATRLWDGTLTGSDGAVTVLPTAAGYQEQGTPAGVAAAITNSFSADQNVVPINGIPDSPVTHSAPSGTDETVFRTTGWVTIPAIAIDADASEEGVNPAAYQVTFAPLANGTDVRIIVTGYSSVGALGGSDFHYGGFEGEAHRSRPLTRVVQQDVRIIKQHQYGLLSPSRIMLGKNVHVTGNLGARWEGVDNNNGHPMVLKSDFDGLDGVLDQKLEAFHQALLDADVDGDNRLRVGHSVEGAGLPENGDFDGDGESDNAFSDATGDGYVDDFDIFINHYDANHDGKVVLSSTLTAGTPAEGQSPEFTADEDLALQMDSLVPDRNHNGVSGYIDANHNGRWDHGETLLDYDARNNVYPDRALGYRDGVINSRDQYAKVNGRLAFRVTQSAWETEQGDAYQTWIRGPIVPAAGTSPILFGATNNDMPPLTSASFANAGAALRNASNGSAFASQVADQLGIAAGGLATYVETDNDATHARYFRADLDDATVFTMTGRHLYERMPFNAPVNAFADWYYRPRYENMVFRDVQIPQGTNALFINCTFVGVTLVHSYTDNTHINWSLYGKMEWSGTQNRPIYSTQPLDRSDFLRYTTGNPVDGPVNYDDFPNPPVINGATVLGAARNTKQYSNNIRFHDCLFVGSIVSDSPTEYTHVRNKFQFTGSTRFVTEHPDAPEDPDLNPESRDAAEIAKSSMMLPNYSVDIGQFNSPTDTFVPAQGQTAPVGQNVQLHGTIVAGVLDIRGTTTIDGSLMLTFLPVAGQGPLQQNGEAVGNPAGFNTTLGYFGPDDGDGESLDPNQLPIVNGQRIVGYDVDNDGIADIAHDQTPPQGARAVPFYGYGRVTLNWNPDLPMPDGIMLPVGIEVVPLTYREGRR
jgi:hypothetical protein